MPPRDYYRATRSSRGGAPPGERGGGGYVAPSQPKPFVDKRVTKSVSTSDVSTGKFTGGTQRGTPKPEPDKTFIKKVTTPIDTSGDTGRDAGIKKYATTGLKSLGEHRKKEVEKIISDKSISDFKKREEIKKRNLGGAVAGSLLAGAGAIKTKKTIADIRKINKWADRTSRVFGKTYTQLGRKINPSLMARTSGEFVPSKIFSKTGYPSGIKNWWMARSSPVHFAGAEKFVNPALKLFTQSIAKIIGPASWLIPSSGAGEQELQWERENMANINRIGK